ncbi:hypothetical protein E2C01_041982 [Portunus trituberculatus]|uniref:Uncharacterized protein n=1 Tax=Portunus trituberculatus TaxID=210409 RepID=A0A5B7FS52_PORTR|nr:hypothetical protein [Portunus trituberculatus]
MCFKRTGTAGVLTNRRIETCSSGGHAAATQPTALRQTQAGEVGPWRALVAVEERGEEAETTERAPY